MLYVVTAIDLRKGYRAAITMPQSRAKAMAVAKQLRYQEKIAVKPYNSLTKIKVEMAKKKATKRKAGTRKKAVRKKSKTSKCAATLGKRGGQKTYSLGHGIFATVYKKKRAARKKKRAARRK
jgi:hypothetical protein